MTWLWSISGLLRSAAAVFSPLARAVSSSSASSESSSDAAPIRSATPTCVDRQDGDAARGCGTRAPRRACSSVRTSSTEPPPAQSASSSAAFLVDGVSKRARVEHGDRAAVGVHAQRAAQRGAALLAVDLEGVVARLRAEDDAAAGPDRRARRAGAGAAGALLAPRLGAAAADVAAGLGRRRALPARGELGAHRLVHERAVEARAEGGVVERRPSSCRRGSVRQPSVRTSTTPLRGPGHGAADEQQVAGGVDLDDLEALLGDALVAHLARAADALEHARGVGRGADRARGAHVVRAVRLRAARRSRGA